MTEQTELRKLLVLHGPTFEAQGVLDFLREHFDIELAEELDAALDAMRSRPFAAVLAETADFLPLERGIVTQQASVVLDTIGDGVCIVGPGGELVWANRRARDLPAGVRDRLRSICVKAYEEFASAAGKDPDRGKRYSLMPDNVTYYEVICSSVRDRQGVLRQVVAVVVDATSRRRQQLKLNAIDRAGRELVGLEGGVELHRDVSQRRQLLVDRIIRCGRDVLNFQNFAVLLLAEDTNRLEMILSEGLSEEAQKYELFASPESNGICGYVAATGRSYICPDVLKDTRYLKGLDGARSSLTVPLRLHGKVIGVLNVESERPGAFNEEDRQFAEIFANYVAVALHILDLLVSERHTTHSRVSGSICAELAGPLNDIVTEISELMEDYIGHDSLRGRLSGIIDLAFAARKTVQRFAQAPAADVLSGAAAPVCKDPVLAGKRILVVDDEEMIRHTIRDVLMGFGCEVDIAANGSEAIDRLADGHYDLVVSDINMPGADGYEVFAEARRCLPRAQVLLITAFGYDKDHSVMRARDEGLGHVLLKPFKVDQLLEACRNVLQSPTD